MHQRAYAIVTRPAFSSNCAYIRKLIYDMGELMGSGASMIELRRTRVAQFEEKAGLVTMHTLADAYQYGRRVAMIQNFVDT